ncbi:unnamed protein product [Spodoptera exigua]|nr:unnamed protein product [Spodoptera exigua]
MYKIIILCSIFIAASNADVVETPTKREIKASLKPLSVCCDIPELADDRQLVKCSNPKPPGPCEDVQCIFEVSGFLTDKNTLNKAAYRSHLQKWEKNHPGWTDAIYKAITDCVDNDPRQHLDVACKGYDVFTCTGIAMLKKCPEAAWKC